MLMDMRPTFPLDDVGNTRRAYAVYVPNLPLQDAALGIQPPDLANVGIFECGLVVLRAAHPVGSAGSNSPALGQHIRSVVSGRAEKEMRRTHARWVVALMTDEQPVRDRTEVQFPGEAVGGYVVAVLTQPSVASPAGLLEVPAPSGLEDAAPEPLLQGSALTLVPAWLATEPRQPLSPFEWPRFELSAAVLAVRQGGNAHVLNIAQDGEGIPDPATGAAWTAAAVNVAQVGPVVIA
jgi:hypothetical protein